MSEHKRLFQCIDLDRTLFDTSRFAKALTGEYDVFYPGMGAQLDDRFENSYKREKTYFLLRELRERQGDDHFEAMVQKVVRQLGASSLILTGVDERLAQADILTSVRPSWGIFTYGDEIDQRMKADIIGFAAAPFLLTNSPDKGKTMSTWLQDDGTFLLPEEYGGHRVDIVTLEDDKLSAFYHLPNGAYGFWLTQDTDAETKLKEAQQRGEVGDNVVVIRSLPETAGYISKITTLFNV